MTLEERYKKLLKLFYLQRRISKEGYSEVIWGSEQKKINKFLKDCKNDKTISRQSSH